MTQGTASVSTAPAGAQTTTVEFHNQTPFPLAIYRKNPDGTSHRANTLAGYARYVQEAVAGDKLSVKLDCNGWSVKTVTAGKPKVVVIGEEALRSRPGNKNVSVTLDVPVRQCVLVQVDREGKECKLRQSIDHRQPAPTLSLPVGTVIKGMDPGRRCTYFWLIVTPEGQPNLFGQTYSTGTGWGVAPGEGEVVLFLDLALGKDAGYQPSRAPGQPFYLLCHDDIPDLAAVLDSRLLDFPDDLVTAARAFTPGKTAAAPASIYDVVEQYVPKSGKQRQSAGVIVLAARVGPSTRAVFYPDSDFAGDSFEMEGDALPAGRALRSLNLETTRTAAQAGMRVYTSLSEDYVIDGRDQPKSVSRFRVALAFDSPEVKTVQVTSWEDDVAIVVGDQILNIGPKQPATLTPNAFNRLVIGIEASQTGAPELLVRTNTMPAGTSVVVYPDQEMHHKLATMADGALQQSGIVPAKYSAEDCAQVQQALQNISRSVTQGHAETPLGVTSQRDYDARQMSDASWVLGLDPDSGRPSYTRVSAAQADRINADTADEIQDMGRDLAQGIGKAFKKAKKAVKKTTKVVVKATTEEVTQAANTVSKGTTQAANTVAKGTTQAAKAAAKQAEKAGDAIVDVGKDIGQGLEVTIHFLDKTAVRFVVKTAKQAATAIKAVIDMIEVAIDKFVEWLRFVFDWGDIKRAQAVFAEAINSKLSKGKQWIAETQDQANQLFATVRQQIDKARGKTGKTTENKEATNPSQNSAKEKSEWFFDLMLKKSDDKDADAGGADKDEGLEAAMSQAVADMTGIVDGFGDFFAALGSGDTKAMAAAGKELALDFAQLGLDVVQVLINAILTAGVKMFGALKKALNLPLNIPVIKQLYRTFIGGKLTVVNLTSFMLGLLTTVVTKVFAGKAPFGPRDSLVQASTMTTVATAILAVLDLIYGVLAAKSTLEAGLDPLSPKTYDTLWRVMLVLKLCGVIEAIVQPFVLKEDAAELLASLGGALKSVGQLLLQITPSNTRRPEILLDAFFGGGLKFVAAGLEMGADTANGTFLIAEGLGAICQLGGLTSAPQVYGGAAMMALGSYEGAMLMRLVSLGK